MDKKESGHEVADELARESLIAISYSVPDKDQSPNLPPKQLSGDHFVEAAYADKAESIRSKLISISYTHSTDVEQQPVSPGKKNGLPGN